MKSGPEYPINLLAAGLAITQAAVYQKPKTAYEPQLPAHLSSSSTSHPTNNALFLFHSPVHPTHNHNSTPTLTRCAFFKLGFLALTLGLGIFINGVLSAPPSSTIAVRNDANFADVANSAVEVELPTIVPSAIVADVLAPQGTQPRTPHNGPPGAEDMRENGWPPLCPFLASNGVSSALLSFSFSFFLSCSLFLPLSNNEM